MEDSKDTRHKTQIFFKMNNLPLVVVVYSHYWFFQQPESLNVGKSEK